MTTQQVKEQITKTSFPEELKKRLVVILPDLGAASLSGLGMEVSRKDSLIIALHLVTLWESFAKILAGLKKNDQKVLEDFFVQYSEFLDVFDQDERRYFLYLVIDVMGFVKNNKLKLLPEQLGKILHYEINMFWDLPKTEVLYILQNHLLFLESETDLLQHVQAAVFENDWDYAENFSKLFSESIFQNKEMFGGQKSKNIAEWVNEYLAFNPSANFPNDMMHVAEFLVKSPSVQKLNGQEKNTLSSILKLLVWLLNPQLNEDEVLAYKESVRQQNNINSGGKVYGYDDLDNEEEEGYLNSKKFGKSQELLFSKSVQPSIPSPKNGPTMVRDADIVKRVASDELQVTSGQKKEPEAVFKLAPSTVKPAEVPSLKPSIQDLKPQPIKPLPEKEIFTAGLSFGGSPMPVKLSSDKSVASAIPDKKALDIDKKLEELEKRVKK